MRNGKVSYPKWKKVNDILTRTRITYCEKRGRRTKGRETPWWNEELLRIRSMH